MVGPPARRADLGSALTGAAALAADPCNRFRYQQDGQAAAGLYANGLGKLGYQAGLRAETTDLSGNQVTTNEPFTQHYFNLFPRAALTYELPQDARLSFFLKTVVPEKFSHGEKIEVAGAYGRCQASIWVARGGLGLPDA